MSEVEDLFLLTQGAKAGKAIAEEREKSLKKPQPEIEEDVKQEEVTNVIKDIISVAGSKRKVLLWGLVGLLIYTIIVVVLYSLTDVKYSERVDFVNQVVWGKNGTDGTFKIIAQFGFNLFLIFITLQSIRNVWRNNQKLFLKLQRSISNFAGVPITVQAPVQLEKTKEEREEEREARQKIEDRESRREQREIEKELRAAKRKFKLETPYFSL